MTAQKDVPMITITRELGDELAKLSVSVWNYLGDKIMSEELRLMADSLRARAEAWEELARRETEGS